MASLSFSLPLATRSSHLEKKIPTQHHIHDHPNSNGLTYSQKTRYNDNNTKKEINNPQKQDQTFQRINLFTNAFSPCGCVHRIRQLKNKNEEREGTSPGSGWSEMEDGIIKRNIRLHFGTWSLSTNSLAFHQHHNDHNAMCSIKLHCNNYSNNFTQLFYSYSTCSNQAIHETGPPTSFLVVVVVVLLLLKKHSL